MQLLVVDDERDIRSLYQQRFRKEVRSNQVSLAFAGSGREAITYLRNHTNEPVTVLTDINMPEMSGLELLKNIKAEFTMPQVFMVTAYGDSETYSKAIKLGAKDLLTKPIDFNLLRRKLQIG